MVQLGGYLPVGLTSSLNPEKLLNSMPKLIVTLTLKSVEDLLKDSFEKKSKCLHKSLKGIQNPFVNTKNFRQL